jgi:hypothetical protein
VYVNVNAKRVLSKYTGQVLGILVKSGLSAVQYFNLKAVTFESLPALALAQL